ncbi:MAG: hypothetical protein JNK76_26490 [Planctomycetales bacterium]|nr:hypothetical protein [Planctomycetales bacterium]MBN8628808.1 hypothetical protein [Planctomycetota bacterium]
MVSACRYNNTLPIFEPAMASAAASFAERQAVAAGACLREIERHAIANGLSVDVSRLPAGFLLEFAAVVQLSIWEGNGLTDFLPADVPTSPAAEAELFRRVREQPQQLQSISGALLSRRLLDLWLDQMCWSAPQYCHADVIVSDADEDMLVEAVAQLLWTHRGEINRLLEG